jgi:hypothetical protein
MILKKTLAVKGLYRSLQARHLLFILKQETGRELSHPHHLLLEETRNSETQFSLQSLD